MPHAQIKPRKLSLSKMLRRTLHFRIGSKPEVTAVQQRWPVHLNQRTLCNALYVMRFAAFTAPKSPTEIALAIPDGIMHFRAVGIDRSASID